MPTNSPGLHREEGRRRPVVEAVQNGRRDEQPAIPWRPADVNRRRLLVVGVEDADVANVEARALPERREAVAGRLVRGDRRPKRRQEPRRPDEQGTQRDGEETDEGERRDAGTEAERRDEDGHDGAQADDVACHPDERPPGREVDVADGSHATDRRCVGQQADASGGQHPHEVREEGGDDAAGAAESRRDDGIPELQEGEDAVRKQREREQHADVQQSILADGVREAANDGTAHGAEDDAADEQEGKDDQRRAEGRSGGLEGEHAG
ncbi:hypothetical protein ACFQL0_00020 [Haloplanus litoreus]|uniref:hypothetical protein n=1 Tax=Haloplanus litoreus TaxID=767515 RepID=UPI0036243AD1